MESMDKLINVRCLVFVLTGASEDRLVLEAAELLKEHSGRGKPRVIKYSELGSSWQRQKNDKVYVLGTFSEEAFSTLSGNCRLIGPLVVIGYLQKGWELKTLSVDHPVFSLAMSGLVVCHTAIGKEKREDLSSLVSLMGGTPYADLTRVTTHLVAGQVGTTKYHVAYKLGKPVLLPSWVESCFNKCLSSTDIFHATEQVTEEHRCRPLQGLHICVTSIEEATRHKISQQTHKNGGTYCGELKKESCTHLIVGSSKTAESVKYKFAKQWGIHCVSLQWFTDSVECGYCLEENNYVIVEGGKSSSTPTDAHQPDWSDMLNQFTVPADISSCLLDGCKVCLSGFTSSYSDKLKKIINCGGGTRYNHLCDDVTHIIVGVVKGNSDIVLLQQSHLRPHVVGPDWLVDSCKQGQRANEDQYQLMDWSKKKGDRLITTSVVPHPPLQNGSNKPHPQRKHGGIFSEQVFVVSDEVSHSLRPLIHQMVESGGGALTAVGVASSSAAIGHTIYPLLSKEPVDDDTIVTVCWLDCCMEAGRLLDKASFELFHPLVARDGLLSNCVFTVSQYSGLEKLYISRVLEQLGAVVQDQLCCQKVDGYLTTTHLLLRLSEGPKYDMAQQKGVPCVTCRWLVDSCAAGELLPIDAQQFSDKKDGGQTGHSNSCHPDFDVQPALKLLNKEEPAPPTNSQLGTQKLLDMFAENLKQATSFTLHGAFATKQKMRGSPSPPPAANKEATHPGDKGEELEALHTTRDDIQRLQQISKDVVSARNSRKRGKEPTGNSKRTRSTRQQKGDASGVDNSQKTPPPGVIYYDDPMGREEKEKILNRLRSDPNDDVMIIDHDRSVPIVTRSVTRSEHQLYEDKQEQKLKELPKVLLSSMSPQERISYSAIVEELGGEVCSSQGFSPTCTHVIVGRPSRSEKYLAAIAAGKWVLHTSYLETSQKEGGFVELGKKGAFEGWRVFLFMDKAKESGFKRLLEAGDASVVVETELSSATHAFVDTTRLKSAGNEDMLGKIKGEGVTCLKPEYIAEYLMQQDPPPLTKQFIVQNT